MLYPSQHLDDSAVSSRSRPRVSPGQRAVHETARALERFYCTEWKRLPLCTIEPLQRVQNAAARLIFELSPSEHITPSLLQLHWLPICWNVQFKLCCFMYRYAMLSSGTVQRIWGESCNQPHSRVPVCDRHLPTSLYRGQGPSSTSGPSLMPARLRGTHCRAISAKQSILLVLENC